MAETASTRLGLPKDSSGSDGWFGRLGWNDIVDLLEAVVTYGTQGLLSARPATGKARAIYWATDQKKLYYWDTAATPSATWVEIAETNNNMPSIIGATVAGASGTSRALARVDHEHPEPAWTDLTPLANWAQYGGGTTNAQFRRIGRKIELRGMLRYTVGGGLVNGTGQVGVTGPDANLLEPLGQGASRRWQFFPVALGLENGTGNDPREVGLIGVRADHTLRLQKIGTATCNTVTLDGVSWAVS